MQYFIPHAICNQVVTTPLHAGYGLEYNDKDKFYGWAVLASHVRSS
jgi:two-component system, OmpR family, phosphate regulon response regulator OmpR